MPNGSNQPSLPQVQKGALCYVCEKATPTLVDDVGGHICQTCYTHMQNVILQHILKWVSREKRKTLMKLEQRIKISKGKQKLTTEQVNEIEALTAQGTMTQVAIARRYQISPSLVTQIKKGGYTRYNERMEQ